MSTFYSDLDETIYQALETSNSTLARQCAAVLKEQGDDEQAERLLKAARKWDDKSNDQL